VSPTANAPRLELSGRVTSPVEGPASRSATATPAVDLGSEADSDGQSLISELSDLSDDSDFQRRVEERGQKRVILSELTTREENGDELNEEEQALLSELRRAQEIETAAWSGGARGLLEVGKIETIHWERYKEALRAETMAAEDEHPEIGCKGGQDGADLRSGEGSEYESEMERQSPYGALGSPLRQGRLVLNAGGPSSVKLKHRDSLSLRQRSTSVTTDAYSQPSRSHSVSSSAPKSRPVSSASQYPVAFSSTSNIMDGQDSGAKTDRTLERGRLSIKNEEEEEAHYQRAGAGPSTASRNGVSSGDAGPSYAGRTSVGGPLASGLVVKTRIRRLGNPGGSAEYPAGEFDDKRERESGESALRLQRDHSLQEREAQRAKPVASAIAGGSGLPPIGVSIPVRTPHARKQNQPDATTAGRGNALPTVASTGSTGRTLRGTGTKRARSPSTGPPEGMVEKVPATKYGGALPPSNPRSQRRSRRDQQQITLSRHGVYAHDFAQQQHRAHPQYPQPAYSQPIYPTTGSNVAAPSQYANGTLLSRSATAPPPVVVHGHAQGLLSQAPQIMHRNTSETSGTTSSAREGSSTSIVVRHPMHHVDKNWT
jgi:hypothetical protein